VLLAVVDRVEAQQRRLGRRLQLGQAQAQAVRAGGVGAMDVERRDRFRVPGRGRLVDARPDVAEPDEVGVRVEHDDAQRRLEQELLEDHAEGVRLAGTGLTAEEHVTVEAAGIQRKRHIRRGRERPDR
jgi:hypothetical protein